MSEPTPAKPYESPAATGDVLGVWAILAVVVAPSVASGLQRMLFAVVRPSYLFAVEQVCYGLSMVAAAVLAARSSKLTPADFGLVRPLRWTDAILGLLWAVIVWVANQATRQLFPSYHYSDGPYHQVGMLSWGLRIVSVVFAAFAEELVFRGYLLTAIRRVTRSAGWAVAVTSLLFGAVHLYQDGHGMFGATLAGVVFALAFMQHGRLWPGVFAHSLYNLHFDLIASEPELVLSDVVPPAASDW